jgi:hypothetical protein
MQGANPIESPLLSQKPFFPHPAGVPETLACVIRFSFRFGDPLSRRYGYRHDFTIWNGVNAAPSNARLCGVSAKVLASYQPIRTQAKFEQNQMYLREQ